MAIDHVVGIGASAGGLEALQELTGPLRAGGRVAYVVAQHLSPEHPSLIVELIAHATSLKVVTAADGMALQPDVIAIAPPNHDMAVEGEQLRLSDPIPRFGPSPSVDLLFESIATHWAEKGVAVVLSGTGSDGARGIRAVRAAGGLTMAQSPQSARFDGMPRTAISLGGVDLILDAEGIGNHLNELIASGDDWIDRPGIDPEPVMLSSVTSQLKRATGIDFSQYKESTLRRQVQRRMALRQSDSLDDYLLLLAADGEEARALVRNLLVTVTSFFRDPEAFAALGQMLRAYLGQRSGEEPLRVWVPGCATGEEVYSIAMVVSEALDHPIDLAEHLKIFGTDLDDHSLAVCRRGMYPISAAKAIPESLRDRFVTETATDIEIGEPLRNCAVFARHNVAEDPPFPKLDLISCRNTLIYFTTPMQERVLRLFLFGLVPGGLLFLGDSESLGNRTPGFCVADGEHRIFAKEEEGQGGRGKPVPPATRSSPMPVSRLGRYTVLRESVPEQHIALLEALVRSRCDPALVLDENHDLVEVIGDVSAYCRLPEGRMSAAAAAYLRSELQAEARALLLLVRADGEPVASQAVNLPESEGPLRLEARPLRVGERPLTVLSFVRLGDAGGEGRTAQPPSTRDAAFDQELVRLERELLASQDTLRRSLAELEQANEELEASSEELQASSEELQSSNEELEASNEELQSTNEELGTINQQLRSRGEELEQLNTDLENIQTSLSQGMVIVDQDLRVSRFSPLAVRVFALVDTDIGQSLLGIPTTVPLQGLREALLAVLEAAPRRAIEASSEEVSYLVQVLPYLEADGRRRGAIITLTDVSEAMALRRAAEAALVEFSSLTDALAEAVWKRDHSMERLLYASRRIQTLTGWSADELCDRPQLLDGAIVAEDRAQVAAARDLGQGRWTVRYRIRSRDGRLVWLVETAKVVNGDDDGFVVGTLADVTEQEARRESFDDRLALAAVLFENRSFAVAVLDEGLQVVKANGRFCQMVGVEAESIAGTSCEQFLDAAALAARIRGGGAGETAAGEMEAMELKGRDGTLRQVGVEVRSRVQEGGRRLTTLIVAAAGG